MEGSKNIVRNVPEISRMTKLYSATSPNMNDQWSGKILRAMNRTKPPPATRWSSQSPPTAPSLYTREPSPAPGAGFRVLGVVVVTGSLVLGRIGHGLVLVDVAEAWRDRLGEVTGGDEVSLVVHLDRQLGERAMRRAGDHLGTVGDVEGGLVARAEHVVGLLLVEGHRAADVRADLREG